MQPTGKLLPTGHAGQPSPSAPKCCSEWLDDFESHLRAGTAESVQAFFPKPDHPEFELIVSEILRVALEFHSEKDDWQYFSRTISDFGWILSHSNIIGPLAFEDFRLKLSHGIAVRPAEYERLGVNTAAWDAWMSDSEGARPSAADSTASGFADTVSSLERRAAVLESISDSSQRLAPADRRFAFPSAGQQIGEFDLVCTVGEGTFSRVFIARQKSLASRPVVLKVASTPLGESQRLARLQHANVVPLYFAENLDGFYLLGMPLLGLVTLKDVIERKFLPELAGDLSQNSLTRRKPCGELLREVNRAAIQDLANSVPEMAEYVCRDDAEMLPNGLPIDEYARADWETVVLSIAAKLAEGLHYAHRRGVQHRDIKPANILLGFDGQPMLLDFNLSCDTESMALNERSIGGTLPYMAPEQLQGNHRENANSGPVSDIYSLGVVMYEALTGRRPHDFSDCPSGDLQTATEIKRHAIVEPSTLDRSLSSGCSSLVAHCLHANPSERYQRADQLAADIYLHLANRPLKFAPNRSWSERFRKFRRRNQKLFSAGALVTVSVLGIVAATVAGAAYYRTRQIDDAHRRYDQFVQDARLAEASLFFADGGSRELGEQLALRALANFSALGEQQSRLVGMNWLDDDRRSEVERTSDYLQRLLAADESVNRSTFDDADQEDRLVQATRAYFDRHFEDAVSLLEMELNQSTDRFVVWFLKGKVHLELREYREAQQCFAMATVLDSKSAISWVARGICCYWLNQFPEALENYSRAIDCDNKSFAAFYNSALAVEKMKKYDQALDWLDRAQQIDEHSARVHMARSRIARLAGDTGLADAELVHLLRAEPSEPEGWLLRGLAKISTDPEAALDDFSTAEKWPTLRFIAGQNRAHVLSEILNRPDESIAVLSELLEDDPLYQPALAGRAVLHARQGNAKDAIADIERCLELHLSPQMHYQIACVYALLAEDRQSFVAHALHHLAVASETAYGGQLLASDRDLDSLRNNPAFRQILLGIEAANKARRMPLTTP